MPQRPKPKRPRFELKLGLPSLELRRIATGAGAPLPTSKTGGTGKPRKSFRVHDALWGACVAAARLRGHNWNGVLRGYCAAYLSGIPEEHRAAIAAAVLRGEAPVFPDPDAEPDGDGT